LHTTSTVEDKKKRPLFTLTATDFIVQTFCTGGKGGQHRNAKQNGVRVIHPASGARAEHRTGRDQAKNRAAAFEKMTKTKEFINWHKAECARRLGQVYNIEKVLDAAMHESKLKVELYDQEQK
jgi:protein subunit release factor A